MSMFFETYRGTIHWMRQMSFCRNLTFKACNTDPYVSLTLLHAVVRWKGLVDRVRVPCVLCLPPPGVVHGTKLGDVLCWDFALLVVMGCWLTGARPDSITAGVPVYGRVRRRRNVWLSGVADWRFKEVDTCFFSKELDCKKLITHIFKWKQDIKSTVGHWIQKRSVHMSTNPDQALGNKIGSSWGMA